MSKILIIEDEDAIADLEKDYLELSDFTVEIAGDGIEGEKKALEEDFDLVTISKQSDREEVHLRSTDKAGDELVGWIII